MRACQSAADHEFPKCERTKKLIGRVCEDQELAVQIVSVVNAGSVAKRQLRVCLDFRLCGKHSSNS
jgi:hypothetical protein